jgi:hypothetical protein
MAESLQNSNNPQHTHHTSHRSHQCWRTRLTRTRARRAAPNVTGGQDRGFSRRSRRRRSLGRSFCLYNGGRRQVTLRGG